MKSNRLPTAKLPLVPLRKPTRLPRQFRRRAGSTAAMTAKKRHGTTERNKRRRQERWQRAMRKMKRFWTVTLVELRMWLAIGAAVLISAIIGILLFSPFFNVREIHIRRQDARLDIEEVQRILSPLFSERLLFVSKAHVRALLAPELPDLQSIDIQKTYPSSITVTVLLNPVLAEVTLVGIDAVSGSGSQTQSGAGLHRYVTRHGYVTASPIALEGGPYQKIFLTDWSLAPSERTRIFSEEELHTILLAGDILRRDYGLETKKILYFIRAREFHIATDKGELWFDLGSPLAVQLQRFRQFLANATLDEVRKYIDLRIEDTIVYQ